MEKQIDTDFDLPVVPTDAAKAKPRIHKGPGESVCISCEG
jgi:hypothetical protein